MEVRETICVFCGAKIIDRSTNHTRKFCSEHCAQADHRRRHGVGVKTFSDSCNHNIHIQCEERKCGNCGWNPAVEKRRKEALRNG